MNSILDKYRYKIFEIKNIPILKNTGVYRILNIENEKEYIGSTGKGFYVRWKEHLKNLKRNKHSNKYLQNAWNKYGESSFNFEILSIVPIEFCLKEEQYWLDYGNCDYNIALIAGSVVNIERSIDFRLKLADVKFPGSYLLKNSDKYKSNIIIKGQRYFLGTFNSREEASNKYLEVLTNYIENNVLPEKLKQRKNYPIKKEGYIHFLKSRQAYVARIHSKEAGYKYIGQFKTKEEAEIALKNINKVD